MSDEAKTVWTASSMARKRWASMTPEQRRAWSQRANAAKQRKVKAKKSAK